MFDVAAQLVNDKEEIHGLDKIQWEKDSWTRLSLIGDETVINLQCTKVHVFFDSVLCLGKDLQHPKSNEVWKNWVAGIQSSNWVRVEHFPRIHNAAALWQNQQSAEFFGTHTRKLHRKNSVHVNVQWHRRWGERQLRHLIFRSTTPLSRGQLKSEGKGKVSTISVPNQIQLIQFIALFSLPISSVSTEQWQPYAKNLRAIKTTRGNLWYWWINQLFLVKSKEKFLLTMKIPGMTKLFGSNTFNKLNRFHQKTKWVNSVRKQDLCVL